MYQVELRRKLANYQRTRLLKYHGIISNQQEEVNVDT